MSDAEASDQYRRTGRHLGIFRDPASADAYAEKLHEDQAKEYVGDGPWKSYANSNAATAAIHTYAAKDKSGKTYQFQLPESATDDEVRAAAVKALGGDVRYKSAIVKRDGTPLPQTDDSALSGLAAGITKPIDKAAEWLHAVPGVGEVSDVISRATGLSTTPEANATNAAWRANNSRTGYQTLGEIAGTLPLSRLPGGAATQGGTAGALLTDAHDLYGTARDAVLGAVGGKVGEGLARGLGGLARGVQAQSARALNAAGVPLTLGQIGQAAGNIPGKVAGYLEDVAAGLPGIGSIVNTARDRGVGALNVAAGNRVLANIGESLPKGTVAGHDMLDAVQGKLSARYQRLVPNLSATADPQFGQALAAAENLADQAGRKDRLVGVATKLFRNRFNGTQISGQQLKDAEAELTRLHGKYANSQGDEGLYGEAIDGVRQALRDLVARSNPAQAKELQSLNTGWAQLKGLRAAVRTGSDKAKSEGTFSPGALLRQSANKGYRDDLGEAATGILPNRTPDSGTAGRLLTAGALTGAVAIDPREHPIAAGALATVGGLNTKAGQAVVNRLAFGARPAAVSALAQPLNRLSRYAPQAVTPFLVRPQQ